MTEKNIRPDSNTEYLSLEDIVFENRNKEYGAYDLRKKYRRFVLIAFCTSFFLIGSAVVAPLINSYYNKNKKQVNITKTTAVELENMNEQEDAPPPPPPPPPPPAAIQAQVAFVAPKVVDSVKVEVEMATAEETSDKTVNEAPPADLTPVVEEKTVVEVEETPFVVVEEQATFMGGDLNAFRNWVQTNLNYPELALENGSEGRVFIQFAINSKGEVCDVKVLRSSGDASLDNEAMRVIRTSPKWQPARQSGSNVKQLLSLPIMFKIQ